MKATITKLLLLTVMLVSHVGTLQSAESTTSTASVMIIAPTISAGQSFGGRYYLVVQFSNGTILRKNGSISISCYTYTSEVIVDGEYEVEFQTSNWQQGLKALLPTLFNNATSIYLEVGR